MKCDDCADGTLTPSTYADTFKAERGDVYVRGLECYICNNCGADPIFADQARRNHEKIKAAKLQ